MDGPHSEIQWANTHNLSKRERDSLNANTFIQRIKFPSVAFITTHAEKTLASLTYDYNNRVSSTQV